MLSLFAFGFRIEIHHMLHDQSCPLLFCRYTFSGTEAKFLKGSNVPKCECWLSYVAENHELEDLRGLLY